MTYIIAELSQMKPDWSKACILQACSSLHCEEETQERGQIPVTSGIKGHSLASTCLLLRARCLDAVAFLTHSLAQSKVQQLVCLFFNSKILLNSNRYLITKSILRFLHKGKYNLLGQNS